MSILATYFILSIIFSLFVIAACMLSSRLSQKEKLVEVYVPAQRKSPAPAPASQSLW